MADTPLTELPKHWDDELKKMDDEVFSPANSRFAVRFTINALLASGKARIESIELPAFENHEAVTKRRLIIDLGE